MTEQPRGFDRPIVSEEGFVPCRFDDETCVGQVTADRLCDTHRYTGRHPKTPDPADPAFCRCGLGLEAWVHTDTTRYRETPLTQQVWDDLRNPPRRQS